MKTSPTNKPATRIAAITIDATSPGEIPKKIDCFKKTSQLKQGLVKKETNDLAFTASGKKADFLDNYIFKIHQSILYSFFTFLS